MNEGINKCYYKWMNEGINKWIYGKYNESYEWRMNKWMLL